MSVYGLPPRPQRRSVTDVLRRGFDNAVANWQLLLVRVAESIAMAVLIIGGVIVSVVPVIGMAAGSAALRNLVSLVESARRGNPDPTEISAVFEGLGDLLFGKWWILFYLLLVVTVLLTVMVAVHSFVVAGTARVIVDAERVAGPSPSRQRFAAFSIERWFAGARENWWAVFWIYNIVYTILGLIVLVPLVIMLATMLLLRGSALSIAVGCLGLLFTLALLLLLAVAGSLWCQKAIVMAAWRRTDAVSALGESKRALMNDFGRHFGVALILIVIAFGASGIFTMGGFFFAIPGAASAMLAFILLPVRLMLSLLSSLASAAIGIWMLAAFAALSE